MPKRGENIYKRKDGRWEGRAVIGYDEKGLPKTKSVLAKTKRECQEKLKTLEAQKTEAENLEIVQMVRALRMTPAQLSAMLSGGTIPGSMVDDNNEQEENSYEE